MRLSKVLLDDLLHALMRFEARGVTVGQISIDWRVTSADVAKTLEPSSFSPVVVPFNILDGVACHLDERGVVRSFSPDLIGEYSVRSRVLPDT